MGENKKTGRYGEPWRLAGQHEYPWMLGPIGSNGEPTCTILANDGYGVMSIPKALAHFPISIGDGPSGMVRAPRMIACVNAMTGIEDPVAFMEEVREVLNSITELERARRFGGPAPEDLQGLDDALSEAVSLASALLEKIGGA